MAFHSITDILDHLPCTGTSSAYSEEIGRGGMCECISFQASDRV